MALTYDIAWNELLSSIPKLDPLFAQKLVQRAWRSIRDGRRWSFLRSETALYSPNAVTTGTVTTSQTSPTVTLDAAANAAVNAIGTNPSAVTDRQFRIGLGPVYNIIAYNNGLSTITLDQNYGESSASGQAYSIYQSYYAAPSDFLRWESVVDPLFAYSFVLDRSKEELDRIDPQRGSVNQPFLLASYKYVPATSTYLYEMWPVPQTYKRYPALYQKRGTDLTAGTSIPTAIPDDVFMAKARYFGYEWAMSNSGRYPELKGINWASLRNEANLEFNDLEEDAWRQDEETFLQNYAGNYLLPPYNGGYGSNYWQSHAPFYGW